MAFFYTSMMANLGGGGVGFFLSEICFKTASILFFKTDYVETVTKFKNFSHRCHIIMNNNHCLTN